MIESNSADRIFFGRLLVVLVLGSVALGYNPPERITVDRPTFAQNTARPLRYRPEGRDFVIHNGGEFYNRPLYGGNTAFRSDAGDMPEVSLYAPGQAGNLRFGVRTPDGAFWLHQAERIEARYRPGAMLYAIGDRRLGDAELRLSMIGLYEAEGLIVRIRQQGRAEPLELLIAFGGAGGKRGARSGDIGCESEPISQFFQLRPDNCRDNEFVLNESTFVLRSRIATLAGTLPASAQLAIADAAYWNDPRAFFESAGAATERPVLAASMTMNADEPAYLAIQRIDQEGRPFAVEQLSGLYAAAERQRKAIAERVIVETPDAFINAAVGALCAATDAIWDERQGSVMHGAVAWRSRYPGWRGPYANDAFGRHDRSRGHLTDWAQRQNTNPIPEKVLGPDPEANYARSHPSKQTNGDIGARHYDMNLIYIDTLIRHLLWTDDLALARQLWPVIERHFAWEQRLFRRPFGPEKLPLYEAYAAIWASDDMQFNGGGVSYTSAYNYYHNRFFAEIAERLGKDPAPFRQEASLIVRAMQEHLWLADRGWYAEYKDLLGLEQVHPAAGLWTFYHTIDSEVVDPLKAWQMTRYVDTQIAHIPIHGPDIPKGRYFTLPTSNWMPYTYSTNNVVMAEAAHTALAYWQAGRAEKAFGLFKGAVLDGMYMGLCPGNAGMTTYFDAARGEAQRDFGDAIGSLTRGLVEGLFGIRPNLPAGTLTVAPGFPESWDSAAIRHPQVQLRYAQDRARETFTIVPEFDKPVTLKLIVPARTVQVAHLTVNGKPVEWQGVEDAVGRPRILIQSAPAESWTVSVTWTGQTPAVVQIPAVTAEQSLLQIHVDQAEIVVVRDPQNTLDDLDGSTGRIEATVVGTQGHRTAFARLEQGQVSWWAPLDFEVRPPYEIIASQQQPADGVRFYFRNNTAAAIEQEVFVQAGLGSMPVKLAVAAFGQSEPVTLSAERFGLLPGGNRVVMRLDRQRTVEAIVTNWHIGAEGRSLTWEPVNLEKLFNDKVTQIFQNEYLSPRSPYCSLAIPKQGIGSWCHYTRTFDVDDGGLRRASAAGQGRITLPQGVPFRTPSQSDADNIIFTSQWDNYPDRVAIPVSGKARHLYLFMAGSTNSMQSRFDNGEVVVAYTDGQTERLALHNPTTWWPIDQDYFIDDFAFCRPEPIPPRVDLKTGQIRVLDWATFKGKGGTVPGGAATVLDVPLRPDRELASITLRTLANEVVIGLLSATLVR